MTVQNTTVKDIYVGNGATTKFPITFQMTDHPEYIKVYITGDDSVAVETENFSVDLGAKTVTYPANGDPLPDGHKITIYRELPLYQLMNLVNQGPFFAENIELSFDDLTFICQQLNEKLNRTLSAGIDVSNFNNTFPVKAGMSFRINDAGDGLVLTEDPARVLPLAKDILEQTKQVKESAVNETTNIKNTAIEELTAIKDAAVNETTEIKDEAVAAKNTAVGAAATAAEDAAQKTVENITAEIDSKVAAAEDSKKAAAQSASSAADSMAAAQTSKEAAEASANSASSSATTATEQADRAQDIADSLKGLAGVTGIATTEEAIAGVVDNKAMTPLKTKEAVATQVPEIMQEPLQNKADLVDGKVPTNQLPEMDYVPKTGDTTIKGKLSVESPTEDSNNNEVATTSWVKTLIEKYIIDNILSICGVTYLLEQNGYVRIGILRNFTVQWGMNTIGSRTTRTEAYPLPYSEFCLPIVSGKGYIGGLNYGFGIGVTNFGLTSVTIANNSEDSSYRWTGYTYVVIGT